MQLNSDKFLPFLGFWISCEIKANQKLRGKGCDKGYEKGYERLARTRVVGPKTGVAPLARTRAFSCANFRKLAAMNKIADVCVFAFPLGRFSHFGGGSQRSNFDENRTPQRAHARAFAYELVQTSTKKEREISPLFDGHISKP